MICPSCGSQGSYQEIEDLSHDGEWIYTTYWQCHSCDVRMGQWEDGFEWGDD